jgi:hypothetical protein
MAEDKKTTSFGQDNPFCLDCGRKMMARRDDDGEWRYVHYSASECVNSGKRFKVATVELEELK